MMLKIAYPQGWWRHWSPEMVRTILFRALHQQRGLDFGCVANTTYRDWNFDRRHRDYLYHTPACADGIRRMHAANGDVASSSRAGGSSEVREDGQTPGTARALLPHSSPDLLEDGSGKSHTCIPYLPAPQEYSREYLIPGKNAWKISTVYHDTVA